MIIAQYRKQYEWWKLRRQFIRGHYASLTDFAAAKGIPYDTLWKHGKNWWEARETWQDKQLEASMDKYAEREAKRIVQLREKVQPPTPNPLLSMLATVSLKKVSAVRLILAGIAMSKRAETLKPCDERYAAKIKRLLTGRGRIPAFERLI